MYGKNWKNYVPFLLYIRFHEATPSCRGAFRTSQTSKISFEKQKEKKYSR